LSSNGFDVRDADISTRISSSKPDDPRRARARLSFSGGGRRARDAEAGTIVEDAGRRDTGSGTDDEAASGHRHPPGR